MMFDNRPKGLFQDQETNKPIFIHYYSIQFTIPFRTSSKNT